jgi:uncharacterized protein (DUF1778 family)
MKRGPGRPPTPKKLAKVAPISIRFSESERRLVDRAAERSGVKVSKWIRDAVLAAASASSS